MMSFSSEPITPLSPAWGVEREHGYTGRVDAEIGYERAVKPHDAVGHSLFGHLWSHARQRFVDGDEGYSEFLAGHYHHGFWPSLVPRRSFEILGVARKGELFAVDGVFAYGTGHEHVDIALA